MGVRDSAVGRALRQTALRLLLAATTLVLLVVAGLAAPIGASEHAAGVVGPGDPALDDPNPANLSPVDPTGRSYDPSAVRARGDGSGVFSGSFSDFAATRAVTPRLTGDAGSVRLPGGGADPPGQYGPFHRLHSPTQTDDVLAQQLDSGEIWGHAARGSDIPSVKAYTGPLPEGRAGVEFYTSAPPTPIGPGPAPQVRWYQGDRGVFPVDDETVGICATITSYCFAGGS